MDGEIRGWAFEGRCDSGVIDGNIRAFPVAGSERARWLRVLLDIATVGGADRRDSDHCRRRTLVNQFRITANQKSMKKKILIGLAVILVLLVGAFFFVLPGQLAKRLNVALNQPPYLASERAVELHRKLLVADLNADSL